MSAVAKLQAVLDEYAGFTNEIVEADREALATVLRDLAALRERVAKVNALAVSRVPPDDEVNFPGCLICGLCGGCDGAKGEPLKHSKDCPVTILAGSDVHTERGGEPPKPRAWIVSYNHAAAVPDEEVVIDERVANSLKAELDENGWLDVKITPLYAAPPTVPSTFSERKT